MAFKLRTRITASSMFNLLALASTIAIGVPSAKGQEHHGQTPLPQAMPMPMPALSPGTASGGTEFDTRAVGKPYVKPVQLLKRPAPAASKRVITVKTTCGQSKASKEVQKLVAERNLAGAIDRWSTEIESKPDHSEAWIGRAKLRRQIGDNNGAQDDLDRALELSPNNVEALIARASVRRRLTDLRGAGKDIDKAVELAPRSFAALSERSSLRFALNDIQGAMADYNYAMSLNKNGSKHAAPQVVAQTKASTNAAASNASSPSTTSSAVTTSSALPSANIQPASAGGATQSTSASSATPPTSKMAAANSDGSTRAARPTRKQSLTAAELARLNNTAVQEINDKHFGAAIKSFERLIEVSPDYAHAKQNLVIAHNNYGLELSVRTPAEAIKHFRAALYLDPTQSAIRKNLSSMISDMGKDPESADDRAELADGCLAVNDHEGAYVELNEAIRLKNSPQLRMRLMAVLAGITSSDSQALAASREHEQELQLRREAARLQVTKSEETKSEVAKSETAKPEIAQSEVRESEPDATHMITATVAHSAAEAATTFQAPDILESPSATPAHDLVIDKLTLETSPEMVLQVARQLLSENHELDAEGLLMRLSDNLRKKSLKGDRAAEAMLDTTLESLSQLYVKANRMANAETALRELVAIREKTKGQDDPLLGRTLAEYSNVLKALGRNEEAQKQQLKSNFILNRALSAQ